MIDLIRDQQPWSRNQIRKRSEAYIKQQQTHGDELMLTRVNDAALLCLRPVTEGEAAYRDQQYLPRAVAGGQLADQMRADNERLIALIALQQALSEFARTAPLLSGDDRLPAQIEQADETGDLVSVDNPAFIDAQAAHTAAAALLDTATFDDWRWLAQRLTGSEIEDGLPQHLAVIRILPTAALLELYVEGEGLGSIDGRLTVENARAAILAELEPAEEVANG